MQETKNDKMATQIVKKEAMFLLTQAEFAERSKRLSTLTMEAENLESGMKRVQRQFKAQIELKKAEHRQITETVLAGEELRTVDAVEIMDHKNLLVRYFYSGKIIEERPMTQDERQIQILRPETAVVHSAAEDNHAEPVAALAGNDL